MTAFRRRSYQFAGFRLDAVEKVLFLGDQPVVLTPKALETLLVLVERHGRLVTKDELFRLVWPDAFVEDNNLAQNISMLRRALGAREPGRQFIETVPKRGYRFVAPVLAQVDEPSSDADGPPAADVPPEQPVPAVPAGVVLPSSPRRSAVQLGILGALIAAISLALAIAASSRAGDVESAATTAGTSRPLPASVTRVAVLPFVNLGSPEDEYFAAGMTEEVISRLAGLKKIVVASSTTVTAYDPRGKSVQRIGEDLGVDYVVEGSVRWAPAADGARVRITPKLIRVADDAAVWTEQYDAALQDIFKVQADIAYRIIGALQVALEAGERRSVEGRPTHDTDAYLAFLRGIAAYRGGFSDTTNQSLARAELEHAVARDAGFALAWAWLARTYTSQYRSGADRTIETRDAGYRAARRAIELDVGLPEGHLALSQALYGDREYAAARRELDIARAGLPNSVELWQQLAHVEQAQGRWKEARAAFMRAFELDPAATADWVAVHYLHMRDYSEARRFIGIARAANKAGSVVPDAWLRFSAGGDVAAARPVLEAALGARSPADARVRGLLARLEWFDGRYERALELIRGMDPAGAWMPANFRYPASLAAGEVYETLGDRERARSSYETAIAQLEARRRQTPDDYQIEGALALAAAGVGRNDEALRHGRRAVELLPVSKDAVEGPMYLYLLARIHSRIGQQDEAFAVLDEMFRVPGFYNGSWVRRDPGFAALRRHPSFTAHLERWSAQKGDALLDRR